MQEVLFEQCKFDAWLQKVVYYVSWRYISKTTNFKRCDQTVRRVEKFKNLRRNIFRVGKYVYVLGGLKKVV